MGGLYKILEIARQERCAVFFPSSIAAFGPSTPRQHTPQDTIQRPTTMYGVTKVAGELLTDYYAARFGVDVRGLRFPGLISHSAPPGGGTTDYAVTIFYEALRHGRYTCFLGPDTRLDMMYMPDAIRATVELMEADASPSSIAMPSTSRQSTSPPPSSRPRSPGTCRISPSTTTSTRCASGSPTPGPSRSTTRRPGGMGLGATLRPRRDGHRDASRTAPETPDDLTRASRTRLAPPARFETERLPCRTIAFSPP